ncbi:MAG: flagellin [Acetobacteraceae bacterium]|nr:flagellin [Acetobacteraceae bacterium]
MSFNSVNTNRQAVFALQSLNQTSFELAGVQKRVSTGFRVSDARDDGGAFAVAQAVRSDVAGVTAVGEQLGGTRGILSTTFASLSVVSDTMKQVRAVLTRMADAGITGTSREQYEEQYTLLTRQIETFIDDAFYNGRTLLSTSVAAGGGNITSIRNESGGTFTIQAVDGEALKLDPAAFVLTTDEIDDLTDLAETNYTAAAGPDDPEWDDLTDAQQQTFIDAEIFNVKVQRATDAIQPGGSFDEVDGLVSTALNQFGAQMQFVENQITYNSKKIDAMNDGLGALVDADLAKESSKLQALQTRQQLGVQTLGIANQGPQVLLSLFR